MLLILSLTAAVFDGFLQSDAYLTRHTQLPLRATAHLRNLTAQARSRGGCRLRCASSPRSCRVSRQGRPLEANPANSAALICRVHTPAVPVRCMSTVVVSSVGCDATLSLRWSSTEPVGPRWKLLQHHDQFYASTGLPVDYPAYRYPVFLSTLHVSLDTLSYLSCDSRRICRGVTRPTNRYVLGVTCIDRLLGPNDGQDSQDNTADAGTRLVPDQD